MTDHASQLARRFARREALVGVIGLGYVGLPLALTFSEAGHRVLGFDTDRQKVAEIEAQRCYIGHLDAERVRHAVSGDRLRATADFDRLAEPDALIVCVPTPLDEEDEPDLGYVVATAESIAATLRPGQLVILESTTYPGTSEEIVLPRLTATGARCGADFFLAYSPEREDPGNPTFSTGSIPKVVGGADPVSGDLAEALYETVVPRVVRVSSTGAAEATKLTENIFRAVNIALVNELKMVYETLGIDIWEVLDAAETKPFGFMRFDPGPGWGGHCIPIDPIYLASRARRRGAQARFIELAAEINLEMPDWVVDKLADRLGQSGRSLDGARVLLLGIAYKRDVADPRESPAFELIDRLLTRGAEVEYHDPHIPVAPAMRSWPDLPPLASVELTPERLEEADAVLIATDHSAVDYEMVARHARLVVDTRGVLRTLTDKLLSA
ncbi:MAG: nucleotide sugar dehydrogenase [Thermoanaerobaculia bacterium]|nr:nucleotide sugar dehydrogenase [Thermoanaerobaculia bacterium]